MENKQKPTIEEVLIKHTGGDLRFVLRQMVLDAMKEWASIETEHLRQENKRLNDLYESAMTELRSVLKSRSEMEQENKTLKAMHSAELKQEAESFEQLFSQWIAFSLPTFKKATPLISLKKLSDEIEEVANELQHGHENLSVEYVDCIMCLLDSAARAKVSIEDLKAAFIYKLEKNKARSWAKNADGTYSHIKP